MILTEILEQLIAEIIVSVKLPFSRPWNYLIPAIALAAFIVLILAWG